MPDREKVINGLELCDIGSDNKCYETECPYYQNGCTEQLKNDLLGLLKEQEPKKRESRTMLPCKCGSVRYEHWCGTESEVLVCKRCGFKVIGRSNKDVVQKWNEAVKWK